MSQRLAIYVHIPYCVKRCGYCDFNTYTPTDLKGSDVSGVSTGFIDALIKEINRAKLELGNRTITSIFFGGGTPTLLPTKDLARVLDAINGRFSLERKCEITIEANPDSVTKDSLLELRQAGFNRISFGMQSSVPHVLATLDRTHNQENLISASTWASEAGFKHISIDLIYGTPGESIADWRNSISTALKLPIDHISAYALIVEKGTKLAKAISSGDITMPDDDEMAEKYLIIDNELTAAGFDWYELSNWAKPNGECRHNIAYWESAEWWGFGPGAHSHIGKTRWWNVKHPNTYQTRLSANEPPINERETLTDDNIRTESLMLAIRMRSGIDRKQIDPDQESIVNPYLASQHIDLAEWENGKLVLTLSGRLIADRIVRELLV